MTNDYKERIDKFFIDFYKWCDDNKISSKERSRLLEIIDDSIITTMSVMNFLFCTKLEFN